MECLLTVREHAKSGTFSTNVSFDGSDVIVKQAAGDAGVGQEKKYPKDSPTGYRDSRGTMYTIEAVFRFIEAGALEPGFAYGPYSKRCGTNGWPKINVVERRKLTDYLKGVTETCDRIDLQAGADASIGADAGRPAKRARLAPGDGGAGGATSSAGAPAAPGAGATLPGIFGSEEEKQDREQRKARLLAACQISVDEAKKACEASSKQEIVMRSRATLLTASKHFKDVLQMCTDMVVQGRKSWAFEPRYPIIIVPSSTKSLITASNVKQFLEGQSWTRPQRIPGRAKPVFVSRGGIIYRVVDTAFARGRTFSANDWNRVVAVIFHGPEWQFKGWRLGPPVDMFQKAAGVHLHFDSAKAHPNASIWRSKTVILSENYRHGDGAAADLVWETVERQIRQTHPMYVAGEWKKPE